MNAKDEKTLTPEQMQSRRRTNKTIVTATAVALLTIGSFAMGSSAARTVEVPGPERTVTKTVEVAKPNPKCQQALDEADQLLGYSGEALNLASEAMVAQSEFDVKGLEDATQKLNKLRDKAVVQRDVYDKVSQECRDAEKSAASSANPTSAT